MPIVAYRRDNRRHRQPSQGAIHSGDLPAQLPVGPRPPVGPGEPPVAVPGLGRRCRTRRRTIHHRSGLHHLRYLGTAQGRGAPPPLHRQAGLSPAAGRGRRHRRRADIPAARGRATPFGAPPHFASSQALALGNPVQSRPQSIASLATPCLTAPSAPDPPSDYPTTSQVRAKAVSQRLLPNAALTISPCTATAARHNPLAWLPHPASSQIYRDQGLTVSFYCLSPLV